jgi:hypothetical protein
MTLDVFNEGMFVATSQPSSGTVASYNFDVPTNPVMTTLSTSFTSGDVLFSAIYTDDSEESAFNEVISSATLQAEYENLSVTKGFNIHCFDTVSSTGVSLATIDAATGSPNINTHYYFVLIHSDDHLKHHFARITEIKTSDVLGDSFDFEPKLGNEIAQGTKFKLYKGPAITSKGVAFSAGIKQDLKTSLQVARPHFWFVNDSLDKDNQLDHNTKYFARIDGEGDGSSITLNTAANRVAFLTVSDYKEKVVDYSKFSLNATSHDTLERLDYLFHKYGNTFTATTVAGSAELTITGGSMDSTLMFKGLSLQGTGIKTGTSGTGTNKFLSLDSSSSTNKIIMEFAAHGSATITVTMFDNERSNIGTDDADYDNYIEHANRDVADADAKNDLSGPTRYLHYDYSPTKNNSTINVVDLEVQESIGNKSSYADLKISDPYRILSKKIINYDALRIRQMVHRGDFNDWISFGATITSYTSKNGSNQPLYAINTPVDLRDYLNVNDEVLINSRVMIVVDLDASNLRFRTESRLETESIFTTSTNLESIAADTEIYRRAWNTTDGTLLTGMKMIDGREGGLTISLISDEFSQLEATVTSYVSQTGLLTISLFNQGYDTKTALDKMSGQYMIYNEKLNGRITNLKQEKVDGATIMNINGADKLKELLDPIIEKNTLFSKDIVYSTDSPYNKVTALGANATTEFTNNTLTLSGSTTLITGDKIFAKTTSGSMVYLGEISSGGTGTSFSFTTTCKGEVDTKAAYKASTKYTVFNKALSSNAFVSSATSLYGTANKGLFFESGTTLVDGVETVSLPPSSINTTNPKSRGYYLSEAKNMKSDNLFQARLDDNASSKSYSTFDTVNTLIDFNILSIQEVEGNQVIEIAPHIPLTLARVDNNFGNTQDIDVKIPLGTLSSAAVASSGNTYLETTSILSLSSTTFPRRYHGKPLYISDVFAGFIVQANYFGGNTTIRIYIDRVIPDADNGSTLHTLDGGLLRDGNSTTNTTNETTKLTHELSILNGAHLHGGKIIAPLHPSRSASSSDDGMYNILDIPYYFNTGTYSKTFADRTGASYYRIINLEKGNVNNIKSKVTSYAAFGDLTYYASIINKIPYYASSYKFNPAFYIDSGLQDNLTGVNKTDNPVRAHSLIQTRGYVPPSGSKFFDTIVHPTGSAALYLLPPDPHTNTSELKTPYVAKDIIQQPDPKVARMFLFVNSDLRAYSSTRKDSLLYSGQTRDITSYNLLALTEPITTESSNPKDNTGVTTKTITHKDGNYSSTSIISSDKTLSSLNRFSMMRLTELCFDWAFNQFDPENPPAGNKTLPVFYYPHVSIVSLGNISSISGTQIDMTAIITIANGDYILDSEGRYIGTVSSSSTISGSFTRIVTTATAYKTNGNAYFTGAGAQKVIVATAEEKALISGHGEVDTFVRFGKEIHMLRSAVINNADDAVNNDIEGYGTKKSDGSSGGSEWSDHYGVALGHQSAPATKDHNTYAPIGIEGDSKLAESSALDHHPSKLFQLFDDLDDFTANTDAAGVTSADELYIKSWLPVFLDRFKIEGGSQLVDSGMVGAEITGANKYRDSTSTNKIGLVGFALNEKFADKETLDHSANITYSNTADGAMLAFKPRLKIDTSAHYDGSNSPDKAIGASDIIRYFIPASGEHTWLKFVDLTGTYLASTIGKYVDSGGTQGSLTTGQTKSLNDATPTTLAYVISHEIDHSNGTETHIIVTDRSLTSDYYRVLQPNHTFSYDYSPKKIQLNTLSSSYTKKPYSQEMYSGINAYQLQNAKGDRDLQGNNEGILSMYVLVDIENLSSDTETVVTTDSMDNILENKSGKYCVSDGENVYSTELTYESVSSHEKFISFSQIKETIGVVSVSEITSITVGGESPIDTNSKRAMIGSVVSICQEADDLIEELLEEQDTPFTITKETYPLFVAPNFDGISIFEAINFLLRKKEQTLIQKNETFEIKPKDSSGFYNDLLISDNGDIRIYEYEVLDSTFEEYNEIIVNGKSHKSKKQDLRSVKKVGRKTLKVFERKLTTQEEVDTRAKELLILHKGDNKKLRIKIGHNNISQIQVGDVVNVEVKQENIPRNQYIVLEITHLMTGLLELELGKYSKQLEDRFSELTVDVDTAQTLQNTKNNEQSTVLGFLETVKIKPIRLLVRKRATTGSMTLGFTTALNTGTAPLGFTGGATITYTDLVEEEF